ncbi:MAG: hypothetical protein JXQ72_07785 [Anaerolineae bacterium]|nr:hypothetical protein [Anaerolineae bacterium]
MGNNKLFYVGIVLALLLSVGLTACGGDDDKGGTKKFFDDTLSIELPGGWTSEDEETGGGEGRVMLFSSSKIRSAESADDLPDNAAFGTIMVGRVYDSQLEDGPEETLRSYLELEGGLPDDAVFETLEINGQPAALYTGIEEQNGLQGYNYEVGIFIDDSVRVFLFLIGLDGDEGDFKETFEKIANSLTVDIEKLPAALESE